jgi:signal transduction histidine kinase
VWIQWGVSLDRTYDQSVQNQNRHSGRARGVFAGLKIRKKLIVLHTSFSLALGILLLVALSPAMGKMVDGAEQDLSERIFHAGVDNNVFDLGNAEDRFQVRVVDPIELGVLDSDAEILRQTPGAVVLRAGNDFGGGVIGFDLRLGEFVEVRARSMRARQMVRMIYGLLIVTLLAGYALVAVGLELFVLPQHVYQPIRAMLDADDAARSMDSEREIVPDRLIPADELGEIMHSRNETVRALRQHERELSETLARLEAVAIDLHTKNRLLETARKNLEGADRLATMGMMSAGIAHELNTPLAVVKGLVSKLEDGAELSETETALLARVVGRIEKLSEGLLDFARVRTPSLVNARVHGVIEDAWTLIKLDRQSVLPGQRLEFENLVSSEIEIACDPDRMVQVFVNLIRNSVHALRDMKDHPGLIRVSAEREERSDGLWLVISVTDNGEGIDPAVIDSLFEPFVSSRMDANGTGLGLAVAEGIVREHGGMVVPSNIRSLEGDEGAVQSGAKFDVHLPMNDSE